MAQALSDHFSTDRLSALCRECRVESASLTYLSLATNESNTISYSSSPEKSGSGLNPVPVFCNVKLLTSTLILILVSRARLSFDSLFLEALPKSAKTFLPEDLLQGTTVEQLLAHTHGLASPLESAPFSPAGFIDIEASSKSIVRLFEPGKYYSYSIIGYVLLGILIECTLGKPFAAALHSEILRYQEDDRETDSLRGNIVSGATICPSSGKGLALSSRQLAKFSELFLSDHATIPNLEPRTAEEALKVRSAMPGWTPQIQGSCFGWRDYGNDWRGHSGLNREYLSYVRINPSSRASLCFTARSKIGSHTLLVSLLLKNSYPELALNRSNQPSIAQTNMLSDSSNELGAYGCSYYRYLIYLERSRLKIEILTAPQPEKNNDLNSTHSCFLYAATNSVFYLSKPWKSTTFIQIIQKRTPPFYYLWDHDKIFPKL
jgi:hypothetical protein